MDKQVQEIVNRANYHVAKHAAVGVNPSTGDTHPMGTLSLDRYPEFKPLVKEIVTLAIRAIQEKADAIQSEMPYKQQFVLEEVAKELQERV